MTINIGDDILRLQGMKLLKKLLIDKTTKKNIMWATDAYCEQGCDYERNKEITEPLITGHNADVIKTRARKAMEQQSQRTKQHAEVFTPLWVVKKMNDHADEVWFGYPDVFFKDETPTEHIEFLPGKTWQQYVDSRRMEITCGEAPYLATRYDVESGEAIPPDRRVGILDRKLRVVNENASGTGDWLKWAYRALEATYGYEFQGDNVLIARVNLLMTFEEYFRMRLNRKPTDSEYSKAANIIAWNIWQMDGLTGTIPYCKAEESRQLSMFEWLEPETSSCDEIEAQSACSIYNWRARCPVNYLSIREGRKESMKFDFIIGNPPYNETVIGSSDKQIYNYFMDESYKIADKVELITPAKFLSNGGNTRKEWNEKMLNDPHLTVLWYEADAGKVFQNTNFEGGVAITLRDAMQDFGVIGIFTSFTELESIKNRVLKLSKEFMPKIMYSSESYKFTDKLHEDFPDLKFREDGTGVLSKGHDYALTTNIFDKLDNIILFDKRPSDNFNYYGIYGNQGRGRVEKYIRDIYLSNHPNLNKWKIAVPKSKGNTALMNGRLSTVIGDPELLPPYVGHTQTFLSIGAFEDKEIAENALKYIKTQFCRVLIGVMKITQHNPPEKWKYVPLQDFTVNSDIDWSQSVAGIDRQLYVKYGLSQDEIDFIETHVKEMK